MKKLMLFGILLLLTMAMFPQAKPVMYFCERYDSKQGEINVGTIFYPGPITVMVKADNVISYNSDVTIQIDRKNGAGEYEYYNSVPFEIPQSSYIYFTDKRLTIDNTGTYRVWLLDHNDKSICMAIVEIVK